MKNTREVEAAGLPMQLLTNFDPVISVRTVGLGSE
jgi:hypothetical protein